MGCKLTGIMKLPLHLLGRTLMVRRHPGAGQSLCTAPRPHGGVGYRAEVAHSSPTDAGGLDYDAPLSSAARWVLH